MSTDRTSTMPSLGLLLAIAIQLISSGADSLEFGSLEAGSDRLPANVVPLEYNIELSFLDSKGRLGGGKVGIIFKMSSRRSSRLACLMNKMCPSDQSDEARDRIVLHMRHATSELTGVDVTVADSIDLSHGRRLEYRELLIDKYHRLLVIRLGESISEGSYGLISLQYRIRDTANSLQDSKQFPLVHSEPAEVYRLFPCLDEPHLKSKLTLTVEQPDANMRIIASMEPLSSGTLDWRRVTFQQTPVAVPLHSAAFAFVPASRAQTQRAKISTVWPNNPARTIWLYGAENQLRKAQHAIKFSSSSVVWMEKYFKGRHLLPVDLRLVPLPEPSTKIIGSDSRAGLGLGAINERLLLIDEASSSVERKIEAKFNVALVVARQWFGTILAPQSGDDVWLTEGLACYFAQRIVRDLSPELPAGLYFDGVMRNLKLTDDDWPNRRRVAMFRGAQMVDMLRRLAGDSFDSTILKLLDMGKAASVNELARAFATKKLDEERLRSLIEARGQKYQPVIKLDIQGSNLLVTQHSDGAGPALPVALKLRFSNGAKKVEHELGLKSFSRDSHEFRLKLPTWFVPHDQATGWVIVSETDPEALQYLQVEYSGELLERLRKPLSQGNLLLNPRERIGIIAGQLHMLEASETKEEATQRFSRLMALFGEETQPEVVLELVRAIEAFASKHPRGTEGQNIASSEFDKFRFWAEAPAGEGPNVERLKTGVLNLLIEHGDERAIRALLQNFDEAISSRRPLGPQTETIRRLVAQFGTRDQRRNLYYLLSRDEPADELPGLLRELKLQDSY